MSTINQPLEMPKLMTAETIIFYDGECGICDQFVAFCLAQDKQHLLKYAPLQGTTASDLLPLEYTKNIQTVVCMDQGKIFTHSSAVVRIFWKLGGLCSFCGNCLYFMPPFLRNFAYRLIARYRFLLMRKSTTCRLLSPAERLRFLP